MKLWVDDMRRPPEGLIPAFIVIQAKKIIFDYECYSSGILDELDFDWLDYLAYNDPNVIELIDIDHDAGDYAWDGGDYIKLLDWLEETGRNYPIRIHSMNTVGRQNMRLIIEKNGWKEIR